MAILKPLARLLAASLVAALAAGPLGLASPARAQPQLVESDPPDGAVLTEPPDLIHLCFSQPLKEDFRFSYQPPDGRLTAVSFVFGQGSRCVDVLPLLPEDTPPGEHKLEWRVKAAEGDEEVAGTLRFQVSKSGTPVPSPSPTPLLVETPTAGATETASGGPEPEEGGGGPDILLTALLTIAVAGGAAVVATLGYVLRRAIGFDPHRPPEDEEGGGASGH